MGAAKYIRKALVTIVRGPNKGGKYTRYFYKGGAKAGTAKKATAATRAKAIKAQSAKVKTQIKKADDKLFDVQMKMRDAERAEQYGTLSRLEDIELNLLDKIDALKAKL